jgi:hypothetical protein
MQRLRIAFPRGQQRQPAARPQQLSGFIQTDPGIDPVESRRGHDEVEEAGVREILEGADLEPGGRVRDIVPGGTRPGTPPSFYWRSWISFGMSLRVVGVIEVLVQTDPSLCTYEVPTSLDRIHSWSFVDSQVTPTPCRVL